MTSRYDELPYRGKAYPYAHPERMAAVGSLFGLCPPDIQQARVLEVGCGDGINLISMAYQYPDSQFFGVDTAPEAILRGTLHAASLGLDNLTLLEGGLEEFDFGPGHFDYIIAHGVFSWVPLNVQQALLQLIEKMLTDSGIAYISYNTLPGWHLRAVARDLMLTVVDRNCPPEQQVQAAREALEQYAQHVPQSTSHGQIYKTVADMLSEHSDAYWYHDFLSPENHAYSLGTFLEMAERHGLQYLAEAELGDSMLEHVPPELRSVVESYDQRLRREEALDHLTSRSFRRTLLCRAHHLLSDAPIGAQLSSLHVTGKGFTEGPVDLTDGVEVSFVRRDGEQVVVANGLVKSALELLCNKQPASLSWAELVPRAAARIQVDADDAIRSQLEQIFLFLYGAQLIDLLPAPRALRLEVSERPLVCRLARWDALQGQYPVTNALHSSSAVTPFEQLLLVLCDGSRTVEEMIEVLFAAVESGDLHISTSTEQELTTDVILDTLQHQVKAALARLPKVGLLELDSRR